jgi:hypothetical protein
MLSKYLSTSEIKLHLLSSTCQSVHLLTCNNLSTYIQFSLIFSFTQSYCCIINWHIFPWPPQCNTLKVVNPHRLTVLSIFEATRYTLTTHKLLYFTHYYSMFRMATIMWTAGIQTLLSVTQNHNHLCLANQAVSVPTHHPSKSQKIDSKVLHNWYKECVDFYTHAYSESHYFHMVIESWPNLRLQPSIWEFLLGTPCFPKISLYVI